MNAAVMLEIRTGPYCNVGWPRYGFDRGYGVGQIFEMGSARQRQIT